MGKYPQIPLNDLDLKKKSGIHEFCILFFIGKHIYIYIYISCLNKIVGLLYYNLSVINNKRVNTLTLSPIEQICSKRLFKLLGKNIDNF